MKVSADIKLNDQVIDSQNDTASSSFQIQETKDGKYEICLYNSDNEDKSVTFFVIYQEKKEINPDDDALTQELGKIHTVMSEVHRRQRMSQQIERRLQTVMSSIKSQVSLWTFLKFAVIVCCAGF